MPASRSEASSQEATEEPIGLLASWSFDVPMQDDELLPQQRVFDKQFGLFSGQIGERAEQKRGRRWFDPPRNTFLECMKTETDALLDRDEETKHKLNLSFVKKGVLPESTSKMNLVDCTRISHASARRLVSSRTQCPFPERIAQVARTGDHLVLNDVGDERQPEDL